MGFEATGKNSWAFFSDVEARLSAGCCVAAGLESGIRRFALVTCSASHFCVAPRSPRSRFLDIRDGLRGQPPLFSGLTCKRVLK